MYPGTYAATVPDKPAVIVQATGHVVTYRELNDESTRLARLFRDAGLVPLDRVAILMENNATYLTVCWAARRIGLYYVPVNWHLPHPEIEAILSSCGAKALVVSGMFADIAAKLRRSMPALRVALAVDASLEGFDEFDEAVSAQSGDELEDETEGDDLIFTSGTTGMPKGGVRPLRGVHPSCTASGVVLRKLFGFDAATVHLVPGGPLYHAGPLRMSMAVTQHGGTNVVMDRFDARVALNTIERYRVTHSQWAPVMFIEMIRLPAAERARHDLASQQVAMHSGSSCPVWVKEEMIDWWGPILVEFYGASEGGGMTIISSAEWLAHRGSVGRPVIGTMHILDERGTELPAYETGLIYSEGGRPIRYLDNVDATMAARGPHGWTTVGDVGHIDDDGYLYVTDRRDDVIRLDESTVYPQEVENVLSEHPEVGDVAVFGVPSDAAGEEVKALVQRVDRTADQRWLERELLLFCRARLAEYKCPRSIEFVDELPRAPSGKLYKRRLRGSYIPTNSAGADEGDL